MPGGLQDAVPMAPQASGEAASPLTFTRRALLANSRVRRSELRDVHPYRFYRQLRGELDELRADGEEPYLVVGERQRDLVSEAEGVGQRTGVFTGRAQARAETDALGGARLPYRPWGPHGALLVAVALGLGLFGLLDGWLLLAAGALGLAGVGLFATTDEAEIPLRRRDVISVGMQGEARERREATPTGHRFQLAAETDVVYAGEVFLTVDEERVPELAWPLRAELSNRTDRWSEPARPDGERPVTGPLDALRAWAQLDGDWTRRDVELLQRGLRGSLADRQAYTELLDALRDTDARERELARVDRELAALEGRMQARAERTPSSPNGTDGEDDQRLTIRRPPSRRARGSLQDALARVPPPRTLPPPRRRRR